MRTQLLLAALLSLFPSVIHSKPLDTVPKANITCPKTPTPWPAASSYPSQSTLPDPFLYLDLKSRVGSNAEWYACRQSEIMQMLQEYQYGFYPDHSAETVTATRTGNTVSISVAAGGKTGSFKASIILPTANTVGDKSPVVIAIGGIDNAEYTKNGIAVVTFGYTTVSPDSNGKTGAFWVLYNGMNIGISSLSLFPPHLLSFLNLSPSTNLKVESHWLIHEQRRPHSLGLGLPPRFRRLNPHCPRNRRHESRGNRLLPARQSRSRSRPLRYPDHRHNGDVLRRSRPRTLPLHHSLRARREPRKLKIGSGMVVKQRVRNIR